MKNAISLILVLASTLCFPQERHRFEAGSQTGYEYNYFKGPDQLLVNGSLLNEDDLIASSGYLDVFFDYDYRYKWKGHRFRASVTPFARIFQENSSDSYWSLDVAMKYDYKLSKKTKLLGEVNFQRMNREGLDGAQDILVNPLGYSNYGGSAGIAFEPLQKNKTTVEGFYNFKNFDAYGIRDLQFNAYGLRLATKQEFRPGRYEHAFGFTAYYKKRLYDTFNAEDTPQNGQRNWDYAKIMAFYELPLGGNLELEPQMTYYGRFDRLENRSGFNQYGPGLRLRFANDKTKISATIKHFIRNYSVITAPGAEGERLQYKYTDMFLRFEHQLPIKGLLFTGTTYSRFRETNTVDLASRSFRGYTNQYAGVGLLWQL
ncbi:hypothetical protein L0P88_21765 [Muricauda sp. SCSIO 64092]|uniref:hypothetical protein n=1 Tax=Allomuricauda sp. SCSIO 64092 TaxID=2908842 RepID=UPI001FF652E4|nr:hypothetical protein [Muricauda sp. SCSIO 64092]UOY06538.1 hypothetical protein L0P88_21765 [Muricauda sp. SCSIO 64092]